MKTLSRIYISLIFLLLYAPIIVMVVFSFNSTNSLSVIEGFSFKNIKRFSEILRLSAPLKIR